MKQYQQVYQLLDELNIDYKVVEHPPSFTTEEADKYIEGHEGVRTKSLFLRNRKGKRLFLLIMDDVDLLDMDKFKQICGESSIGFCSADKLKQKMNLEPGVVSLFGLINNDEHDIEVFFDKKILEQEYITFHPNDNSKTLFLKMTDMFRFLKAINYEYKIIEL